MDCLFKVNHKVNHKKRADSHPTDNQDYNDFNNKSLGGVWSLVRIQSPRLVKEVGSRMDSNLFLF